MPEVPSFGEWLRRRRKALDLTQEALARAVACSRFAIRKIEADERRPSRRLAERLADGLAIASGERPAFLAAARSVRASGTLRPALAPAAPPGAPDALPFVGRDDEWRELTALLARAASADGRVALLAGEPGVGKSRLILELERHCAAAGHVALSTRCYEIERAMAYQPVIELAARALERTADEALRRLPPVSLAEIAALVPAVAARVAVPSLSGDFPEARKARLYAALVRLLEEAAAGGALAVAFDDLQWADDASLEFVHYLARQALGRPLLLVCAYRAEEADLQERLAALIRSLRREPHASLLALGRLKPEATRSLVERLGHPALAVPGLAERLQRESDGHPFFLASMLQAIAEGAITPSADGALPLPETLRASVRARLAHVPPESRAVLDVAAVLGRRFDFETLALVAGGEKEPLARALELLVRRRLLREEAEDGVYDFSHDKVREVAYREIGGARRVTLHRAVAEALEARPGGETSERDARLAEHYERGHAWEKALDYLVRAAERSQKLFAMRDALHWLDRAVALGEAHPEAARDLAGLYERRGGARAQAGQTDGAVADMRRVIDDARARGDATKARDALIQLGMAYRRADDYARAAECLAQALEASRAMGDERRIADTLYHLGTVAWSDGRNGEARACHREAVERCERLGLGDLVAVQAWHGRGETHFSDLEPQAAIACYQRSIELARGIGDRSYECENLMMIGFACVGCMGLADYPRAEASLRSALDIARAADLQWHMGPTLLGLDHVRGCTGRADEGLRGMLETLRWLEGLKQHRYQLMAHDLLSALLLELGRPGEAEAQSEQGLRLAGERGTAFWRPRLEANLVLSRVRLGRPDGGPMLEAAAARCRAEGERYQLVRCLEALAELSLARGEAAACLAHADELLALAEPGGLRELCSIARHWRGAALSALGRRAEGEKQSELASALAAEVGRPGLFA